MDNIVKEDDLQLEMGVEQVEGPAGGEAGRSAEAGKAAGAVRLRQPERRQMAWVAQGADDLVGPGHAVRRVAAVVEHLDLAAFRLPIKAREGVAGRDATDPQLLAPLELVTFLAGYLKGMGKGG